MISDYFVPAPGSRTGGGFSSRSSGNKCLTIPTALIIMAKPTEQGVLRVARYTEKSRSPVERARLEIVYTP